MNRQLLKRILKNIYNNIPTIIVNNMYRKPKLLIKILCNPSTVWKETYFPEVSHKNKYIILLEQIKNILLYTSIDEYYYMYGLDVKREIPNKEYVIYSQFSKARDNLNLSNPHNDSSILRNKLFFGLIASGLGIATPDIVAYSDNGRFNMIDSMINNSSDWIGLSDILNRNVSIYGKPLDGQCGVGIIKLEKQEEKLLMNGESVTIDNIHKYCQKGKFIFQTPIRQHPEMQRLYPGSVNTIRLTTVRNINNRIEILPPTLRIGAHGSFVDNFSKGGVIVPIELETGELAEWGFFKPMYGLKSRTHPDTNIEFLNFKIPYFTEVKRMAILFHSFLNLHSIGWDVAITENGPVFIEGNDNWEINLPQTFKNPFKKEFNRLFRYKKY